MSNDLKKSNNPFSDQPPYEKGGIIFTPKVCAQRETFPDGRRTSVYNCEWAETPKANNQQGKKAKGKGRKGGQGNMAQRGDRLESIGLLGESIKEESTEVGDSSGFSGNDPEIDL
ncbi:MAG: hypothetical protein MMC23_001506 [Stictis urceolatum]|nr:hypothetical protein [Stictis urceolata]